MACCGYKVSSSNEDDSATNSDTTHPIDTNTDSDTYSDTATGFDTNVDTATASDDIDSAIDSETDSLSTDCDMDCMEIVWLSIPGGTYQMGNADGDYYETPVHPVTVPNFEMTMTEITVWQYSECVDSGICTAPPPGYDVPIFGTTDDNWGEPGYGNHPINEVSWEDGNRFCEWIGARLPTDAEWEYAARNGGQAVLVPWEAGAASCDYAVLKGDSYVDGCDTGRTMPVCSKLAGNTVHGLCDMIGNVGEWVQDYFHESYEGAPDDGSAWEDVSSTRVIRVTSYTSIPEFVRATTREGQPETTRHPTTGFRCARSMTK